MKLFMSTKAYSYKDVYLVPRYSATISRGEIDVSRQLGEKKFKLPIIPANMVTCISAELARKLSEDGYFYIMHRFLPEGSLGLYDFCEKARIENWKTISISIGVKEDDYKLVSKLPSTRCDYITIDIAHGDSIHSCKMLGHIHRVYQEARIVKPYVIAGNVASPEGVLDLCSWGADAVKIGIAGGAACSTKDHCGFHVPMWTCVAECVKAIREKYPEKSIIADGGVRENGDIAKALAAGADFVMAGSMFAACINSPGENVYAADVTASLQNGYSLEETAKAWGTTPEKLIIKKRYYGSASARNKGYSKHVEGVEIELPCNGMSYAEKFEEIKQDLQSAASYAGGALNCLEDVRHVFI